jgi:uncharacterized protein (DUF488 family)
MSDLKLSLGINDAVVALKEQTIDAIISILTERNHTNIELHKPIHYAELTDDWVIHRGSFKVVRLEEQGVIVNFNNCSEAEEFRNLSIEQLIELLMVIERNGYEYAADGDAIELK